MKILLISFSEHYTYQETIYNLQRELDGINDTELWTIGSKNLKLKVNVTKKNILVDCPSRPGITMDTFNLNQLNSIINTINTIKPDKIMFYSSHVWNILISTILKTKYKMFHVIHDVTPHKGDKQEKFVYIYNWVIARLADKIVLHNERFIDLFCSEYKYSREKVEFTELWRKYEVFSPLKKTGRCLFFGRINYYKGINHLLSIVKKCPDIHFDVVGKPDSGFEEIINELAGLRNVHLNNSYVDDNTMAKYFNNADWIILPYDSATQSGVVIDAYSYSRPVIAFKVGAMEEQVKQGISGYLVKAADTDAFVKTIMSCFDMTNTQKEQLCYSAWEFGYEKYSIQNGGSRFLKLFEE